MLAGSTSLDRSRPRRDPARRAHRSRIRRGHLDGAEQLDFNGGEVAAAIPGLDPDAEYLVYCRSGNRSGQAIALMEQAGFSKLTNLGSLEQAAAATGIEIVR
ncbi:rhodanese-like domain-containing protein [Leucobacter soli]|uniref:rhodanese-like domain-containing protein n=1 Tax=Leucobacter soli TaxID=2812850 RepID=UPI0036084514